MQWVKTISQLMDMSWKWNSSHSTNPHQRIWNSPPKFLQHKNCNYLLQKEVVLLTITLKNCMRKKKSVSLSDSPLLIQKGKTFGLPQNDFWASPMFQSKILSCSECSYIIQYITFKTKFNTALSWRWPRLIIDELFPCLGLYCYAFKIWRFKKPNVYLIFCSLISNHLNSCWTQT